MHIIRSTTAEPSSGSVPPAGEDANADELATLASEVLTQVLQISDVLREEIAEALDAAGTNVTRLTVLRTVASRGDDGCSQADLACVLGQAESSVCTLIERMKKDGLVHRFRSKVDRRKSFLMLTPEGGELLTEAEAAYTRVALSIGQRCRASLPVVREALDGFLFSVERPVEMPDATRRAA